VLAEVVGPGGLVVGLDRSPDALATARQLLDEQGLGRVDLVRADIATADPAAVAPAGLFDAAHCRYVLMHHPDPAATLRRIVALVRPGGTILVRDLVDDPTCCRCEPPLPALARGYALMFAAIGHLGGAHGVARRYRAVCRSAGIEVVEQRALVSHFDAPTLLFSVVQSVLLAMRSTLEEGRLSTDGEVASLVEELEAAKTAAFDYVQGPLMVDLLARVPAERGDGPAAAAG
jgi:SAM-dependent methyltransferase